MSMEFKVNGNKTTKTVTVSDKDAAVFKRYMGYDLNQTEVEGYLAGYFMDLDHPEKNMTLEEGADTTSDTELSTILSEAIIWEMQEVYGYKE